jgi:ParB family chromosome partitioning protein
MTTDHDSPEHAQPDTTPSEEAVPGQLADQAPPWRAMMPVSQLAAHPGNVRADLDLNEAFVASIAANGVLVALRVTPDGDGFRVIDGGRRLAAALKAGVEEVPYDVVAERAGDEAGQYLDMITTNRHRNPLTVLEEADALFAAKQAGATRTRLRKTTGMAPAAVNEALAAARLTVETRDQAGKAGEQLTLDQYAVLAEFQDDPAAVERLLVVARWGSMDHEAERIRQQRAELAEHDQLRTDLETAGYQVADTPPGPGPAAG